MAVAFPTLLPAAPAGAPRPYAAALVLGIATAALTVLASVLLDLPLRDPDTVAGPSYVRLPGVVALALALDVLPRALRGRRSPVAVARERWTGVRVRMVLYGLAAFYLTYVGYRNLKSFLPFARPELTDADLLAVDRALGGGSDPATLLHALLGTGATAQALAVVYVAFLAFVPISLATALVWSRDLHAGYWYVTALCLNWILGTASYYLLPSLGPVFFEPGLFAELPVSPVSRLQDTLLAHRVEVLADPHATPEVHGIAGFASLHVSITLTAALIAQALHLRAALRHGLWAFFALTVVATIYFGWHYVLDDVAGVAIGVVAVWLAALATGRRWRAAPA